MSKQKVASPLLVFLGIGLLSLSFESPSARAAEPVVVSGLLRLVREVDVPAAEAGILSAVNVKEGMKVEKGDILATLDDREVVLMLTRAEIELEIATRTADTDVAYRLAEKTLRVAEEELKRGQTSVAAIQKVISQQELDRLQLAADEARLAMEKAKHEQSVAVLNIKLKQAEVDLAKRTIDRRRAIAPFSGVVADITGREGEWIEPGKKLIRLVQLDKLRCEGFIPAKAAVALKAGTPVQFDILATELPKRQFQGVLVFVSPEVNPVSNEVRVIAEIDNADQMLRPGYRGQMTIRVP
ncbi:secretion protein HlyD family protein [Pirellula staleyi DSM 6068]|uniref:Secretion protein HlyD family protein n=1 Tax=Pirellula staleyi (strain ATCC 27377 / DSM 6068 / ICPB 4128) TaxID=530564 RepID=D2QZ20_PIRSD|nr:efflux RND transporter periplasmic adaptor subunit [Pirellula staleyi]ADB16475.1 secretion protein HlyD family protein [Pirellula staleyi DSM 6068]